MINRFIEASEILELKQKLIDIELPGSKAFKEMMPYDRILSSAKNIENYRAASVLLSIFEEEKKLYFPLIKRAEDGYPHSGQISFPGGGIESGETIEDAAVREAYEEIGILTSHTEIIGRLTTLIIPVSSHIVHPVVSFQHKVHDWIIKHDEVAEVLKIPISFLFDESLRKVEALENSSVPVGIPYFDFYGHKVWGATAMILNEFSKVLKIN